MTKPQTKIEGIDVNVIDNDEELKIFINVPDLIPLSELNGKLIKYGKFYNMRPRRDVSQLRGKFRAQTQSQYLNIPPNNENKEGKAQAEATPKSSHAIVSKYLIIYNL